MLTDGRVAMTLESMALRVLEVDREAIIHIFKFEWLNDRIA